MNKADSINDQEPLVKIVRGICKVNGDTYRVFFMYGQKLIVKPWSQVSCPRPNPKPV